MLIHFAAPYHRICISCKMRSTPVEPVLLSRLQGLLFSAKVNHLIKCAFYTNTPLKRPKQETIRIFVIAVLQFYCKYRLPGCARRPQHHETSIAFFSNSPLTEMNHFCSKRFSCCSHTCTATVGVKALDCYTAVEMQRCS